MENSINKINDFKVENNNDINLEKDSIDDLAIDNIDDSLDNNIVENIENVENKIEEKNVEIKESIKENKKNEPKTNTTSSNTTSIQDIENIILEDGIKEIYDKMDLKKQQKFEIELNKTSLKIYNIINKFRDNLSKVVNKIFVLIRSLIFKFGVYDYGYTEKIIKMKVESIIRLNSVKNK